MSRAAAVALILLAIQGSAISPASAQNNPFTGTWTANPLPVGGWITFNIAGGRQGGFVQGTAKGVHPRLGGWSVSFLATDRLPPDDRDIRKLSAFGRWDRDVLKIAFSSGASYELRRRGDTLAGMRASPVDGTHPVVFKKE